jgi:hypothetical protein
MGLGLGFHGYMALEFAFTFAIGCTLFGQRWGAESQIMNHDSFCKFFHDDVPPKFPIS